MARKLYLYEDGLNDKDSAFIIRIPILWKDNVESWFKNFEALTNNLSRTDDELANDVISQLDAVDKALVSDIVDYPPLNGFYEALKKRLVSLYKDSDLEIQARLVVWSSESYRDSRTIVFDELIRSGDTLSKYIKSSTVLLKMLENISLSSSSNKSKKENPLPLCYYHEKFGSEAINCAPPCGYHEQ